MESINDAEKLNATQYNRLSMGEKAIILWNQGRFIETWKEEGKHKIGIYLLYDTIVSVYYNIATDSITNIIMWGSIVDRREVLNNTGV